jgi:hypothetical protein
LLQTNSVSEGKSPTYAIAGDFCRVFGREMNSLYLLAFLLTADSETAELCFVQGLDDCVRANGVFKEWARSWARRTIIQKAIRIMQPMRERSGQLSTQHPVAGKVLETTSAMPLSAILGLKRFERFVFVLSVLERYPDQDCKLLLGCSREDVVNARARAVESIAAFEVGSTQRVPPGADEFLAQAS